MLSALIQALVATPNEAADEALLEALRLGTEPEKALALNALIRRQSTRGLSGVIEAYDSLPSSIQDAVLQNIKAFHSALRECGRSERPSLANTAMKLIAIGRQGKLTYVLSEALHNANASISRVAVETVVALSRWAASETRRLQRGKYADPAASATPSASRAQIGEAAAIYRQLMQERPEIEQAVARAMDVHRGSHGQDLLRAALLLADSPLSATLCILNSGKHNGQNAMIRRLQQPPESENVEAFLLAASHGGIRGHFGVVFSHISEPPVLDAILHKTHWLKDIQLQLCMRQVSRGVWLAEGNLEKELGRRDADDIARIGEWIASSALHDVMQDERLDMMRGWLGQSVGARLRLLRIAMRRPRGASVSLLQSMLSDPDERIARMAVREIVRRQPIDYENMLIGVMSGAPESVRRVIGRSVGQVGFEHFWMRFERMDKSQRQAAGRAMFKMLPDSLQRLERRMRSGPIEQRIKAITIAQELGVADQIAPAVMALCQDANARLRSKAVGLLSEMQSIEPNVIVEKALNDTDARVRANAIEVLEVKRKTEFLPVLVQRARSSTNRERANAIKALHRMRVNTASSQLANMIRDERPEHRISAMWALKQIGWWQMLQEVGRLAKADPNIRVRRYAMAVLRGVAEMVNAKRGKVG